MKVTAGTLAPGAEENETLPASGLVANRSLRHHGGVARTEKTASRLAALLSTIVEGNEYYALTLLADESGRIFWERQTEWIGEGSKPMWEIRGPSLVEPTKMRYLWEEIGEGCVVVNEEEGMAIFLRIGGNALVERLTAERWLPEMLEPVECAPGPLLAGTRPVKAIPKLALNHAPTKKLRMDILRRDEFRCRICGRRAADYVDIELHVHHIRPHGKGGLTEVENLITLCHTCHTGLDPHFDIRLLDMLPGGTPIVMPDVDGRRKEFSAGVQQYRYLVTRITEASERLANS